MTYQTPPYTVRASQFANGQTSYFTPLPDYCAPTSNTSFADGLLVAVRWTPGVQITMTNSSTRGVVMNGVASTASTTNSSVGIWDSAGTTLLAQGGFSTTAVGFRTATLTFQNSWSGVLTPGTSYWFGVLNRANLATAPSLACSYAYAYWTTTATASTTAPTFAQSDLWSATTTAQSAGTMPASLAGMSGGTALGSASGNGQYVPRLGFSNALTIG